jgi:hypothetical protein
LKKNETSEILCKYCEKLKLDLLEASSELSSARKIIILLQEEISRSKSIEESSSGIGILHHDDEQTQTTVKEGNWIPVLSNQNRRN